VWDLSWSHEGATSKRPTLAVTTGDGLTTMWQVPQQADQSQKADPVAPVAWVKIDA
jgi:hypothetical protein